MEKEVDPKVDELMRVEFITGDCNSHINIAINELLLEWVGIFKGGVVKCRVII